MKKIISVLLAVVLVLSLAACGKKNEPAASAQPAAPAEPAPVDLAPADTPIAEVVVPAEAEEINPDIPFEVMPIDELTDAALAEGSLVVYGSCDEDVLNAACDNFRAIYGINVEVQCLSADEVLAKLKEGNADAADVWFGAGAKSCDTAAAQGLLEVYSALNDAEEKSESGTWYGVYGDNGAVAVLKGCAHPAAARLWLEYALTPDCAAG